jgi:phosphotransacetylase
MLAHFSQLLKQVKSEKQKTIAVVKAEDKDILIALEKARAMGLAQGILTGGRGKIVRILKELKIEANLYEIIAAADEIYRLGKTGKSTGINERIMFYGKFFKRDTGQKQRVT